MPQPTMDVNTETIGVFLDRMGVKPEPEAPPRQEPRSGEFDLESFLSRHLNAKAGESYDGGTKYILAACPFNEQHKAPDSAVIRLAGGAIVFRCLHNSCSDKKWQDVRQKFEPFTPKSGNQAGPSANPTPNKRKTHSSPTNREYQKFPVGAFPGIVAEFIQGTADAINVDEAFVGMPVLAVMGAAVGGARQILIKKGYAEPAVIWGAVVANSGAKKSPALDAPCKAVIKAEMRNVAIYEEAKTQYDAEVANHKAALADWQRTGKKKGEPAPELPEAPICRRFIVSDITKEALAPKLKDNPRGLLSKHDELSGFFGAMNQYKAGKGADEAAWLSMFGARELIVDRKGSGSIVIPRAPVSIIGGIQPEILKRLLTREHFESGMSARFLLAYPPPRVSLWTEDEVDEELEKSFADTIQKLQRLDYEVDDEDGSLIPVYCPLTADAKARWIEFYNENAIETSKLTGDLSAAWPKLTGYAARFALIIRFANWAQSNEWEQPKCIDLESLQAGITLSQWFANETKRVYSLFAESPEDREIRELIEVIKRHGGEITPRDLCRHSRRYPNTDVAEQALQGLVNLKLGEWLTITGPAPTSRRFALTQIVDEPT